MSYSNADTKAGILRVNELAKREDVRGLIAELESDAEDGTISVRSWAARKLGQLRAREAVVPLSRLIADRDEGVRVTAIVALGSIGDDKAATILRSILTHGASVVMRRVAAEELGRIRDPRAKGALMALLSETDQGLRRSAAVSLAAFGDLSLLPRIEEAVRHESFLTRRRIRRLASVHARRQR